MVDDSFLRLWISLKRFLVSDSVSLSRNYLLIISSTGLVYSFSTLAKSPEFLGSCRFSNKLDLKGILHEDDNVRQSNCDDKIFQSLFLAYAHRPYL